MHLTCVPPAKPGEGQQCPVCKSLKELHEHRGEELPQWHVAELGATNSSGVRSQMKAEAKGASFPEIRWPSLEEARVHGYDSLEEWFVDFRCGSDEKDPKKLYKFRNEFKEREDSKKLLG